MVHLRPLPGSPNWTGEMGPILEAAQKDAHALVDGGCDALLVENMGDLPYLRGRVEPETVAAMSLAVARVSEMGVPVGVQLLAGANREALEFTATNSFIRVEAFAYGHVADEGGFKLPESCAPAAPWALRRHLGRRTKKTRSARHHR